MKFFKLMAKFAVAFLALGTLINIYRSKTKPEYITFERDNELDLY